MDETETIDCEDFSVVVRKLRTFFEYKGFIETHTQDRLSILAACEDPETMSRFQYLGHFWPLPQTGQMWLEHELLQKPHLPGLFCVSTSYRNEQNPVPGRHNLIFPMFEFELKGDMETLLKMEKELLQFLGFKSDVDNFEYAEGDYEDIVTETACDILTDDHEALLEQTHGSVYFLKHFPMRTSPFWNMKINDENPDIAEKIDVILHGMETIGSAERSTNKEQMRSMFTSISDGKYSQLLYDDFTEKRVNKELEKFLEFDLFERSGGGIGINRLIRAMKLSDLMDYEGSLEHVSK